MLRFSIFAIKKKGVAFYVNHHSKFTVIGYTYSIYTTSRLILCAESITLNPATSTAESAHGVSWCAEIGRPTYAFASLHRTFRSLFADFRRFSPLSGHIDFLSLKMTQISKCISSSSFCPIKILTSTNCS
jgi:hypothetical protein